MEVHVGDIGTVIQLTLQDCTATATAVDLSTASAMRILVLKPDGSTVTWTAEFADDGSDGVIQFTTLALSGGVPLSLDQAGVYYLQPEIEWAAGTIFTAATQQLLVHPTVS